MVTGPAWLARLCHPELLAVGGSRTIWQEGADCGTTYDYYWQLYEKEKSGSSWTATSVEFRWPSSSRRSEFSIGLRSHSDWCYYHTYWSSTYATYVVILQYLDCLWAQIENLKMNGWVEKHIVRPYISFDSILCEALQHNLPQITLPPHHENMRYPLPRVVFRMFDYTDCGEVSGSCWNLFSMESFLFPWRFLKRRNLCSQGPNAPVLPGAHSIERYLIEQELTEIIRKYHKERREW